MTDVVILAVVIGGVIVAVSLAVTAYNRVILRRRSEAHEICIFAMHDHEPPLLLTDPVAVDDPSFDYKIEEARSVARIKLVALQSHDRSWRLEEHSR